MEFKYKAYLPSLETHIPITELKTRDYLTVVKTVMNKQEDLTLSVFEEVINSVVPVEYLNDLTRIDKFFILITVRALCVGSVLTLHFEDTKSKKPYTSYIHLMQILQELADIEVPLHQTYTRDKIQVTMATPTNLNTIDETSLVVDCIKQLKLDGNVVDLKAFTDEQRDKIIQTLPAGLLDELRTFVNRLLRQYDNVVLFNTLNPHDPDAEPEVYKFNMFNNIMYNFLTTIYSDNINNIYEMFYILCKRVKIDIDTLYNHTYAEVRMYLDMYEQELKRAEEARKAEQNKKQGMSPAPIGNPAAAPMFES